MLAMKTYRDRARAERGIRRPEMVVPITAHAAFDKAAQYFGIKMVRIPVDQDYRADIRAAARAITRRTVVVVGSAPSFPHGMVDPIAELSELARQRGVGFHTDACLGGFVLPWADGPGLPGAALRFPTAGRHLHLRRHPQIRLRRQGHLGHSLPQPGTAALSVLHDHGLAGRPLLLPLLRRQPAGGAQRGLLGRHGPHRASGLSGTPPGASWKPPISSKPLSAAYRSSSSWATRSGSSPSAPARWISTVSWMP
jgi:hypothetical protein